MSLHPKFKPLSDGTGLDIVDPIENRHFSLHTGEPVLPTPSDPDAFTVPVETACRITTTEFSLPYMLPVDVRTPGGDHRASIDSPMTHELPNGDHLFEFHAPIKFYLRVSGRGEIEATTDEVTFTFESALSVEVGARSYHTEPAGTITVPDDPVALMDAVSVFSSALKETSPERAWPTLRGHPPKIERGDRLSIPDEFDSPNTGIRIRVPPEYWAVYTAAPLAYYLGATISPGDHAGVTAKSGVVHPLGDDPTALADGTEALLKRVFFLDCVVRTEGRYEDPLHEREMLESYVDLDFAALYDASPAERLAAYLDVPEEAIDAISSPWHRVTHVGPGPDAVELLPYVVNDLSLVRPKMQTQTPDPDPEPMTETQRKLNDELDDFLRAPPESEAIEDFLRSAGPLRRGREADDPTAADGTPDIDEYVSLPEVDALEQAWIGEGTPTRGTKLIPEAFTNETPEPSDGTIEVTVVCNDEEMREELESVGQIYDSREDMRVSVTSEFGVSTDELRDLLARDSDMFHFIGHIDGHGFQCPDGILDAGTLAETNATTALLNGCRSHDQGVQLVKAGASAAVVSLSDLYNSGAINVGEILARLLHHGFDIGSAMEIVREYTLIGNRYAVVGDPCATVSQHSNLLPTIYFVDMMDDSEELFVEPYSYPIRGHGIGSTFKPDEFGFEQYHVTVGSYGQIATTYDQLKKATTNPSEPFIVNEKLIWSDRFFRER